MSDYSNTLSTKHPGCIIFMIDQSGSMGAHWRGTEKSCSFGAAKAVNSIIGELVLRCMKGEEVSPRVMMGFFGYSADSVDWCAEGFPHDKSGLVSIKDLAECDDQILDEETEVFIPWVVADNAYGNTPMKEALSEIRGIADMFAQNNPDSFPPILINITDGRPTDMDESDLPALAETLKSISTSDGSALVWNIHISAEEGEAVLMPGSSDGLADEYAQYLFEASSELPKSMVNIGRQSYKMEIEEGARCFAFNANATELTKLLVLASSAPDADRMQGAS